MDSAYDSLSSENMSSATESGVALECTALDLRINRYLRLPSTVNDNSLSYQFTEYPSTSSNSNNSENLEYILTNKEQEQPLSTMNYSTYLQHLRSTHSYYEAYRKNLNFNFTNTPVSQHFYYNPSLQVNPDQLKVTYPFQGNSENPTGITKPNFDRSLTSNFESPMQAYQDSMSRLLVLQENAIIDMPSAKVVRDAYNQVSSNSSNSQYPMADKLNTSQALAANLINSSPSVTGANLNVVGNKSPQHNNSVPNEKTSLKPYRVNPDNQALPASQVVHSETSLTETSNKDSTFLTSNTSFLKPMKARRPFKVLSKDPLVMGNPLDTESDEDYASFRERMLKHVQSTGTCKPGNIATYTRTSNDPDYLEKRRKNNLSARRSRDRRRIKEDEIAVRVIFLERENLVLRSKILSTRKQIDHVKTLMHINSLTTASFGPMETINMM